MAVAAAPDFHLTFTLPPNREGFTIFMREGGFELPVQGQPTRTIKAGDGFQIPPETPHAGGKPSDAKSRILITYVVEKGKPLASPA
jgi:quercetin dioxygenase-like cupin family protein